VVAYGMGELQGQGLLNIPMDKTWSPGHWHQIAFAWDREGAHLYVDGEEAGRTYESGAPNVLAAPHFVLGGPYFVANETLTAMDELVIFNRRLSAAEIKALYRAEAAAAGPQ
jgi:hypothetical protein